MPSFVPGGCTCMPDPVGVPDTQNVGPAKGLANMQYMGRIKLPKLEYLNKPIELDHWANWFFHIFMDTNKSAPNYGRAPSRLASAYAGTAVYDNWVFEDPKITDPTVWNRGIPTSPERVGPSAGKFCMDTHKTAICSAISQSTFPPAAEAAGAPSNEGCAPASASDEVRTPFFPAKHKVLEAIEHAKAQLQQIVV